MDKVRKNNVGFDMQFFSVRATFQLIHILQHILIWGRKDLLLTTNENSYSVATCECCSIPILEIQNDVSCGFEDCLKNERREG